MGSIYGYIFTIGLLAKVSSPDNQWYMELNKPSFTPPPVIFQIVWPVLYILMAVSAIIVFWNSPHATKNHKALLLFFAQLFFNLIWTLIFFGLNMPFLAFVDIFLIVFFLSLTLIAFWQISKLASILLWPYFLWLIFALVLNAAICYLN